MAALIVAEFRVIFEDQFVPKQYRHHFRQDFLRLKQGERSIEQYTSKFYDLASFTPKIADDDEELKAIYIEGLRCGIH